jgi:hypothetical protein
MVNDEPANQERQGSPEDRRAGVNVRRAFFLTCGGILIVSVVAWIASGFLMDAEWLDSGATEAMMDSYRNFSRINSAAYRIGVGTFALMAAGYMMDMMDLLWPGSED